MLDVRGGGPSSGYISSGFFGGTSNSITILMSALMDNCVRSNAWTAVATLGE